MKEALFRIRQGCTSIEGTFPLDLALRGSVFHEERGNMGFFQISYIGKACDCRRPNKFCVEGTEYSMCISHVKGIKTSFYVFQSYILCIHSNTLFKHYSVPRPLAND